MLTRHVRLFGKFFRRVQQLSFIKFVKLPLCSELILYYWNKVVQASEMPAEAMAGALRRCGTEGERWLIMYMV